MLKREGGMTEQWIVVVEDDHEMRDHVLIPGLHRYGFLNVVGVASAAETYRTMLTRTFDLFVLDISLPDENGFEVARHVRTASDAGIVMLSGRAKSRAHRVLGLNEGADAYLTKPVDMELLAATVRSVLRRRQTPMPMKQPAVAQRTGWHVEANGWTLVSPAGARITLAPIERVLIGMLIQNMGNVISREKIISLIVRQGDAAQEFDPHRLEMLIHRLRRKVSHATGEKFPLSTARGLGYVFTVT